jgi:pyruvate formate lyase activating enzyme
MPEEEVWSFLKRRQGTLEGVVISGGEPTLQEDLVRFMGELKALGYKTKLETNGTRPEVLRELSNPKIVDFIAMDLKAPFDKYAAITGIEANSTILQQSMDLIRQSGLEYQFRTTYDKEVLTESDIATLSQLTQGENYKVQECLPVAKEKAALKVMHEEL